MGNEQDRVTIAAAAIVEELRKQRGLTQAQLAKASGIAYGTLRNICRADVELKVPDLVAIAGALSLTRLPGGGPDPVPITPAEILDMIIDRVGGMSEVVAKVVDLQARRLQGEAEQMPVAEIEHVARAALKDEQMDKQPDEPEAP